MRPVKRTWQTLRKKVRSTDKNEFLLQLLYLLKKSLKGQYGELITYNGEILNTKIFKHCNIMEKAKSRQFEEKYQIRAI